MDRTKQNVQILGEILFFETTYNTKINKPSVYLSFASWMLGCYQEEEGTRLTYSQYSQYISLMPFFLPLATKHPTSKR